jgi:phosphoribosylanthranilate isomerase
MFAKICGITKLEDARYAVRHGATALGFVLWARSPRYIDPQRAAEIVSELSDDVTTVGVFVNQPIEEIQRLSQLARIRSIQLHGDEPVAYARAFGKPVWRAASLEAVNGALRDWPADLLMLLDAHDPVLRGGTGRAVDWSRAAQIAASRRVILAGGLTPENVGEAIAAVRPFGVDVSSGVESSPGVKDSDKVARFLESARLAFQALNRED